MNRTKIKELIIGLAKHDLCPVIMDAINLSENDVNLETNAQPMVDGVMIYLEDSASNILFAKKIMESIYTLYDVILSSFVQCNDGRDGYDEYFFAQGKNTRRHQANTRIQVCYKGGRRNREDPKGN